eukprot:scaffold33587_cov107-Skeletonema_dohrnii-CCMP3373.AAC.4
MVLLHQDEAAATVNQKTQSGHKTKKARNDVLQFNLDQTTKSIRNQQKSTHYVSDFARRCKDFAKILSLAIKKLRADTRLKKARDDVLQFNLDQTVRLPTIISVNLDRTSTRTSDFRQRATKTPAAEWKSEKH